MTRWRFFRQSQSPFREHSLSIAKATSACPWPIEIFTDRECGGGRRGRETEAMGWKMWFHIVIYLKFGAENLIQYFNSSACLVGETEHCLQSEFRNVTSTNQVPTLRSVTINNAIYMYMSLIWLTVMLKGGAIRVGCNVCTWILVIFFWQEIL